MQNVGNILHLQGVELKAKINVGYNWESLVSYSDFVNNMPSV
jgi:hypothetical protein